MHGGVAGSYLYIHTYLSTFMPLRTALRGVRKADIKCLYKKGEGDGTPETYIYREGGKKVKQKQHWRLKKEWERQGRKRGRERPTQDLYTT